MIDWYYRDKECHEVGPLTLAEFEVCVVVGEILPETPVWRSGLAEWVPYETLLAQEEEGAQACRGRRSGRAPQSSSYRTFIALGASPTHRRGTRARMATSGCTPHGVAEPSWIHDRVENVEYSPGTSDPILDRAGADAVWLGRQFVRIAVAGMALVIAYSLLTTGRTAPLPERPTTVVAEPKVVLGPLQLEGTLSTLASSAFDQTVLP